MAVQTFWSRLSLTGEFTLETGLRIGVGDGVALDSAGNPIIPGSTFRGALRAYIEAALRGMHDPQRDKKVTINVRGQDGRPMPVTRTVTLCCDSVDKRDDANYQGCLTKTIVAKWEADPVLRPNLDTALTDCSCQVCRLFGAAWLAGKVVIPDLVLSNGDWSGDLQMRGGLAVSRDRDIAIKDSAYQREYVPAGLTFRFQLVAEHVTPTEQGIIVLGIRAFENGLISLGGDRSRGFGRGRLAIDWWNCRYIDADHLIGALLGGEPQTFMDTDAEQRLTALARELGKPYAPPSL
jgi:CRISPR-associated RAMP protein (TIGR02581 family)